MTPQTLRFSEQINLEIDHRNLRYRSYEIHQFSERAFDIPAVVAHHRHADHGTAMLVQRIHFRDRDVMCVSNSILQALHDTPFVLQRHRIDDRQLDLKHANRHCLQFDYSVRWNVSRTYASNRSPTLMSSKFASLMPHSRPAFTSLASSFTRRSVSIDRSSVT